MTALSYSQQSIGTFEGPQHEDGVLTTKSFLTSSSCFLISKCISWYGLNDGARVCNRAPELPELLPLFSVASSCLPAGTKPLPGGPVVCYPSFAGDVHSSVLSMTPCPMFMGFGRFRAYLFFPADDSSMHRSYDAVLSFLRFSLSYNFSINIYYINCSKFIYSM